MTRPTAPGAPAERGVVPSLLVVVLIWGASYSAVKAAQSAVPPLALTTFRTAVSAVVLPSGVALAQRR